MSRIILAYGQIRSAGVLKGTELRQLTEAGVPILEKLADKIYEATGKTVALGDVFDKVSQKAISFEMVKEVFEDMSSITDYTGNLVLDFKGYRLDDIRCFASMIYTAVP